MASKSETGHATNIANFDSIIKFVTSYGTNYNPSKAALKLPALTTLYTSATTAVTNMKNSKTAFKNAASARETAFAPLKKLSTRLIAALKSSGASAQTIDNAKESHRKIQGTRAKPIKKKEDEDPNAPVTLGDAEDPNSKANSVSQQSYVALADNFETLVITLTAEPLYIPNEIDLKLTALNTLLAALKAKNSAVGATIATFSLAMAARNKALYEPHNGMFDIAAAVKNYLISVYGTQQIEYKQVVKLKFTKPREEKKSDK